MVPFGEVGPDDLAPPFTVRVTPEPREGARQEFAVQDQQWHGASMILAVMDHLHCIPNPTAGDPKTTVYAHGTDEVREYLMFVLLSTEAQRRGPGWVEWLRELFRSVVVEVGSTAHLPTNN